MARFSSMNDLQAKTGRQYVEQEGRLVLLRPGESQVIPPSMGKVQVREDPKPVRMNKTECRFRDEILEPALRAGEIRRYAFEALNLRLGEHTFHRPDFYVVTTEGRIEIREVKGGFIREDAKTKFKMAAAQFPEFCWQMWQWANRRWTKILEF
jgi:hypothetical protein